MSQNPLPAPVSKAGRRERGVGSQPLRRPSSAFGQRLRGAVGQERAVCRYTAQDRAGREEAEALGFGEAGPRLEGTLRSARDTFPRAKISLLSTHWGSGTSQSSVDTLSLTNACVGEKVKRPLSAQRVDAPILPALHSPQSILPGSLSSELPARLPTRCSQVVVSSGRVWRRKGNGGLEWRRDSPGKAGRQAGRGKEAPGRGDGSP